MRERPEVVGASSAGEEVKRKRIDLSVPQVAGSAVAAVVAAKLASYFGVYGTILGAGLVSVVATCGGSLFQHFFRRTGEQFRDVQTHDAQMAVPLTVRVPPATGEFTEGTVHRARIGRRKRPMVAAALVFGVAMAGITTYELVSGDSFSGDRSTTVGQAVTGGGSSSGSPSGSSDEDSATTSPSPSSSSTSPPPTGETAPSGGASSSASDGGEDAGDDTGDGTTGGTAPTPAATEDGTGAGDSAAPAPTESATTPAPSASSRSGTGDQDPADPAAP
ncbi:hypothetical protein ACIRPU_09315 [Streptomyces sp. NPDC102259]|uniref:hypothetical protein n=1 Tax=Streptomyces sp. NPDC102259 TaxID=3366148 RepID=UPI0037FD93EC